LYTKEKKSGRTIRLVAISELLQSAILSYRLKLSKELDWSYYMANKPDFRKNINKWSSRYDKILLEIQRIDKKYNIPIDIQQKHTNKSIGYGKNTVRLERATGLEFNTQKKQIYVCGTVVKEQIIKGRKKTSDNSPLTQEKNKIREKMHSAKFRRFILANINENISVNKTTIEIN